MHNTQQMLKLESVDEYNHCMNGVDLSAVFCANPFVRKTRKWWRKQFFYMLEVSVVNSFILYCEMTQKKAIFSNILLRAWRTRELGATRVLSHFYW